MALVNRHERSINLLKDQGGLAPYLSTYLFDASQAWIPETLIEPDNWYREDLNEFQKNAVKKMGLRGSVWVRWGAKLAFDA